ncbi:MAG: 3-oxoacyl-ACP reductase FabG [Roseiarcus sp.]
MNLDIAGKTAVVTGAARGIGAAIAARFAQEGVRVVVADINREGAEAHADAIERAGGKALAASVDVTDAASVDAMLARAQDAFGAVDILVNNAGFTRDMRIGLMSEQDWDAVVDVILKGAFICTKAAIGDMTKRGWGRVVNISSRAHLGNPGQANYSAAKAGLLGFTRAMALEVGRFGVTVNAVAPGIVDTEAVRSLRHFEKIKEAAQKTTPIQRLGNVSDVADAVVFLASERASYITGEVLHVTGGRY